MPRMLLVLLALVGLALGVLVNALADSLPPQPDGTRGPVRAPHCLSCRRSWPLADWLALAHVARAGGRCRHCGVRRPWRAIWVELLAGAGLPYLWLWAQAGGASAGSAAARFLAAAALGLAFLLIFVIDLEHRLILRVVVLPAAALAAVIGALVTGHGLARTLWGGLVGFGLFLGVYYFAQVYGFIAGRLRGRALDEVPFGFGDVNLAAVVGFAVGWPGVVLALILAIVAAAACSLVVIAVQLLRGRYSPHFPIPYGPFLIFGALTMYLYTPQVRLVLDSLGVR